MKQLKSNWKYHRWIVHGSILIAFIGFGLEHYGIHWTQTPEYLFQLFKSKSFFPIAPVFAMFGVFFGLLLGWAINKWR